MHDVVVHVAREANRNEVQSQEDEVNSQYSEVTYVYVQGVYPIVIPPWYVRSLSLPDCDPFGELALPMVMPQGTSKNSGKGCKNSVERFQVFKRTEIVCPTVR